MSKVAFLLSSGFEDSEMKVPYDGVTGAGHQADIIGLKQGEKLVGKKGEAVYTADKAIADVQAGDYDAVVIPGGSSPENLRLDSEILRFVKEADGTGKPIAAICHGPQILISAELLKGRTVTSYPPLQDDVVNAGAQFKDEEVVVDGNFITSRTPKDEPAFVREILKALQQSAPSR
ncbi:type 1 glutamine amidotransferase domain-containing protein [Paenibacillus glufosinatiresistens]|uniref:type 1 glutamine amidotransferase domain-containing protein n=1 Tax=Paenibacillus glufosinatiresistens TaxID=3070657 RepID=UPI00286DFA1D|nr:type 1 glutamine amidotransferase domain-containing protein [Paenibacillus sp. YX.27]